MRKSPAILIAATAMITGHAALSDTRLLHCSAEYKARADWFETTGGNPVTSGMMRSRAALFFHSFEQSLGPQDWNMNTGFGRTLSYEPMRDELALAALTRLVETFPDIAVLPTCMEDSACRDCLRLPVN
jgi:hypothetical protein